MWYKKAQFKSTINLKTKLNNLRPQMAQAAQKVYDQWNVLPGEEIDNDLNGGGICQDIADAIVWVIDSNIPNIKVQTVDSQGMGDQHVWVCAWNEESCFDIDISPYLYERGGGYNWTKIPGVIFTPNMISITPQRYKPENY